MAKNRNLIRIQNTRPTTIQLPKVDGVNGAPSFDAHNLLPGGNNVDGRHLAALKDHAQTRWYFEHGWLIGDAKTSIEAPEGPETPESLGAYTEEGAKKYVDLETDRNVLVMWLKNEHRVKVKDHIALKLSGIGLRNPPQNTVQTDDTDDLEE